MTFKALFMSLSGWVTSLFIYFTSVLASFSAGAEVCGGRTGLWLGQKRDMETR